MAVNTPNSSRERPATGEPTAPYRPGNDQPSEHPRPIQVALIPGSGPQPVGDIERLLRKRLRVIVLIIWLGLRSRGTSIRGVVSGRWGKPTTFLRDLGLAVAFLVVALPCLEQMIHQQHGVNERHVHVGGTVKDQQRMLDLVDV